MLWKYPFLSSPRLLFPFPRSFVFKASIRTNKEENISSSNVSRRFEINLADQISFQSAETDFLIYQLFYLIKVILLFLL